MTKGNICLRCGDELSYKADEYGVTLVHIMKLNSSIGKIPENDKKQYIISFLLEQTNGNINVITEYVTHKMGWCTLKTRDCPECGNTLKTWRAKLCLECGAEFEPLYDRKQKT